MAITLCFFFFCFFFSTLNKDRGFKIQRIDIIQAMVMQALTEQYIILLLNNFNSCLQTVIIQNIAFGRFSTLILHFLDDKKVSCSAQVIITLPPLTVPLVSMLLM